MIKSKFRTFSLIKKITFSFIDKVKSNNQLKKEDNFFYEKTNLLESQNLISVDKKESKLRSKLSLEEPIEQPLVENEAYRELYKNFSLYVGEQNSKELDEILHNQEKNGKVYKYGLPVKNELNFTELMPIEEEVQLPKTATESLFEKLELDKDSSYESLILKFQNEFNHEADMYGNLVKAGETPHKVFEWGVPIPLETIKNDKIMIKLRRYAMYNVDLPGNFEDIHPNKFIANLRPIEEFRHTPVVAIPEKEIREYKKKIEEKNRMGVFFEVKKQTLYYYGIGVLFAIIVFHTFKYFYKESENLHTELEKIKLRRYRYREEDDIN